MIKYIRLSYDFPESEVGIETTVTINHIDITDKKILKSVQFNLTPADLRELANSILSDLAALYGN